MKKHNSSRSFSNRRTISPELILPVRLYPNKYKEEMSISVAKLQSENATYQAKVRYTQTMSGPKPVFQEQGMTTTVQYKTEQLSSETELSKSSFEDLKSRSSFKHVFERVAKQQASKLLKESPQSALEWQYATGGIIPYGK